MATTLRVEFADDDDVLSLQDHPDGA